MTLPVTPLFCKKTFFVRKRFLYSDITQWLNKFYFFSVLSLSECVSVFEHLHQNQSVLRWAKNDAMKDVNFVMETFVPLYEKMKNEGICKKDAKRLVKKVSLSTKTTFLLFHPSFCLCELSCFSSLLLFNFDEPKAFLNFAGKAAKTKFRKSSKNCGAEPVFEFLISKCFKI